MDCRSFTLHTVDAVAADDSVVLSIVAPLTITLADGKVVKPDNAPLVVFQQLPAVRPLF